MHYTAPFALVSVAIASRSAILEAPDDACGYLNGIEEAPFGCHNPSEKCAIYYPTSSMAAPTTLLPMITPAPQPSVICYEPSLGDCTVQPTACVDSFGDCTGACIEDPLILKCTEDSQLYCNRARFESPLSYRNIMAMDSGLGSTVAPADGWFCGAPPSSAQRVYASHNKTASMAHIISSPVSITTTLDVTITLSKPGPGLGSSISSLVSPTTTLSVTITLSRPGQTPGPSPLHAMVSTAYIGQTNRLPLIEATRPWNVVIPTTVATSTTSTMTAASPRRPPLPEEGTKNRIPVKGVVCGSIIGFFTIVFFCWAWRHLDRRSKSGQQQLSAQNVNGHQLAAHQESLPERRGSYREHIEDLVSQQAIEMVGVPQNTPDYRSTQEQPPDPALRRQQRVCLGSTEATTDDVDDPAPRSVSSVDDFAPQSEGSSEQEAYENALGIRGLESSNRASNVPRGRFAMF